MLRRTGIVIRVVCTRVEVWSAPGGTAPGSCGRRWWRWGRAPLPAAPRCGKNPRAFSSSAPKSADPSPASTHTRSSNQTRQEVHVQLQRWIDLCTGDPAGKQADSVCVCVFIPCSRGWSTAGPGCTAKWAAALCTAASTAACPGPASVPSSPFPVRERQTPGLLPNLSF